MLVSEKTLQVINGSEISNLLHDLVGHWNCCYHVEDMRYAHGESMVIVPEIYIEDEKFLDPGWQERWDELIEAVRTHPYPRTNVALYDVLIYAAKQGDLGIEFGKSYRFEHMW
jgi:hypothetical protein